MFDNYRKKYQNSLFSWNHNIFASEYMLRIRVSVPQTRADDFSAVSAAQVLICETPARAAVCKNQYHIAVGSISVGLIGGLID